MLQIGQAIKNFTTTAIVDGAIDHHFSLAQYLGKQEVLLFFYPKDFTFVCPTELLALQSHVQAFEKRNVALVACSTDTAETHLAWLRTPVKAGGIQGVSYPLIADEAKTFADYFGVLGGCWGLDDEEVLYFEGTPVAYRGTFLIDKQGIVRYQSIHDLGLGRSVEELLRVVDMWQHTEKHGVVCPANWRQGHSDLIPTHEGIQQYMSQRCSCNHADCRCGTAKHTTCCQSKTSIA